MKWKENVCLLLCVLRDVMTLRIFCVICSPFSPLRYIQHFSVYSVIGCFENERKQSIWLCLTDWYLCTVFVLLHYWCRSYWFRPSDVTLNMVISVHLLDELEKDWTIDGDTSLILSNPNNLHFVSEWDFNWKSAGHIICLLQHVLSRIHW